MTPLPNCVWLHRAVAWRLDQAGYAPTCGSGKGGYRVGGRRNSKGVRAVYVRSTRRPRSSRSRLTRVVRALDTVPDILTAVIVDISIVHVVDPASIPNPN
jgi:RES domain-containing protein